MQVENTFAALGLAEPLLRALAESGYSTPTPIQQQAIPVVLGGRDLLAAAQTGTGKTAGFALPIIQQQMGHDKRARDGRPRVLILTPTRELAAQVEESVRTYAAHVPVRSFAVFGGVNINTQSRALRRPVEILVATPGRLLDHVNQGTIKLTDIETLVLDEADRMLDMGFIHDIKKIMAKLPAQRQNLLFSATFSAEIRSLAQGLLKDPASVDVAPRNTTAERVAQSLHIVDKGTKRDLLIHLVREHQWFQVLVFSRTKHGADRLAEQLTRAGIPAQALHGNKAQNARIRTLDAFKNGKLQVLVATDIAARGIDVDQLPMVVNYELPNVPEDYVHRIGRTGRAGAEGRALSLVDPELEAKQLRDIERLIGQRIERIEVAGFTCAELAQPRAGQRPNRKAQAPAQRHSHRHQREHGDQPPRRASKPHDGAPRQADGKSGTPPRPNSRRGKPAGSKPQR
ncbi:DEAD/DEAH box helicase [Nitrogeniibacter mangrovi]|uniref:DEAD-box ATP-dependent RNA helicase RhpA n=1 Tax=Nitrogeniibacter mangrovi TaxID=2016596 RepID=A0A6C1B9Z2_9RHOO|nr:DEAD/DEAH box helicase [Nitrogeniibacter mangrovi]QID19190.1 DEAD/DEAH box helicase [Nitrogeniibacter mangrovi]